MQTAPPSCDIVLAPVELRDTGIPGTSGWRIHVYAHTHWDREWYRTYERFRMQLVGAIDRILDTLDADPRFATFVLDGQTIVLEDYLAIRPEEEPRLRRLIGAGRIEVGPWHVLPDEFLVSGESLVRNLLEGRRVASRFGTPLAVGYLPDPFGHIAQLPAILRGFGIDNVIFSRGMCDAYERTGSEFRWQALDGTDVLAIVQTSPYTNGYCNFELAGRGNGPLDEAPYEAAAALAKHLTRSARTDVLLFAAGCDHETLQAALPDIVERLEQQFSGCDVRISGLDAMVASVREAERRLAHDGRALETHRGELRGSLHAPILASIFSARVPLKQQNDYVQMLLERHVEPLMARAVATGVRPARDVEPFLRQAWRLVLENHPHDSIGGCSIDAVHDEMHARSLRAIAIADGLVEDLRIALDLGDVALVHDAEGRGGIVERGDGQPVAITPQPPTRMVLLADAMPAAADAAPVVSADSVAAGSVTARVAGADDSGEPWLEIVDAQGGAVRLDWIDEADAGDEYDFGAVEGDVPLQASLVRWSTRIVPESGGVAELLVEHELSLPAALDAARTARSTSVRPLRISTCVRVAATSTLVQLVVELENTARDHRLRLRATSTNHADRHSTVEALGHFAHISRPVRPAASGATWKQLPPGLDHCSGAVRLIATSEAMPEGSDAVVLVGRGIHEYEARPVADGHHALELTVLRCVGWLSRDDVAGRPGHAGPGIPTPGAQMLGQHRFDLAVGVGAAASGFDDARAFLAPPLLLERFGPEAKGESGALARARDVRLTSPVEAVARYESTRLWHGGEHVVVSACKLADDGSGDLIVRWFAPTQARAKAQPIARLKLDLPVQQVLRARLDETPLGPAPFQDGAGWWKLKPGGILTLRIKLG